MSSEIDLSQGQSSSVGGEIVSGLYKYEGWKYRISGVLGIFFGAGLSIIGVIVIAFAPRVARLGLFILAVGIILILFGVFYIKRAKTLSKGKLIN